MIALRNLPWRVLAWMSVRRRIGRFEVCISGPKTQVEAVFGRATAALDLIGRYDALLKQQIEEDVRLLLFTESSGASYLAGIAACRVGISYALKAPTIELAMTFVHEATHARLAKVGHEYRGLNREAIERACVAAEINFASRIPGSESAIEKVQRQLGTSWWDDGRMIEATFNDLRERGVPEWMARWLARRAAR
jgi:hypothetical protein